MNAYYEIKSKVGADKCLLLDRWNQVFEVSNVAGLTWTRDWGRGIEAKVQSIFLNTGDRNFWNPFFVRNGV